MLARINVPAALNWGLMATVLPAQSPRPKPASIEDVESRLMLDLFVIEPPPIAISEFIYRDDPPLIVNAALLRILDKSYAIAQGKRMPLGRVLQAAGALGLQEAVPKVRQILEDKSMEQTFRMYAARALGRLDAAGNTKSCC